VFSFVVVQLFAIIANSDANTVKIRGDGAIDPLDDTHYYVIFSVRGGTTDAKSLTGPAAGSRCPVPT
jgi:hypothetical protein